MKNFENLSTERNFRNLIKQGLNPSSYQMERYQDEMGDHMEQILSPEIFNYAVSELQEYKLLACIDEEVSPYFVSNYCSSVWQISKMDVDFSKLHNQFMDAVSVNRIPKIIGFFEYYLRYLKKLGEAEENGIAHDGYSTYIPDEVTHVGTNAMMEYFYSLSEIIDDAVYSRVVAGELAEKYKTIETTFECDGVKYIVKIPHTSEEIKAEAMYMRNCLVSRIREYCAYQWIYAFIRRADTPDVPFIDAVIGTGIWQELGPHFVITKNHVDVFGTSNEAIFNSWYVDMGIEDIVGKLAEQNLKAHPEIAKFLNTPSLRFKYLRSGIAQY